MANGHLVSLLVALLMVVTGRSVSGLHVQYELFSSSECPEGTATDTGIMSGGVNECMPSTFNSDYSSIKFSCAKKAEALTMYPRSTTCEPMQVFPGMSTKDITVVAMKTCMPVGNTNTFIKFTCVHGAGYITARTSASEYVNCSSLATSGSSSQIRFYNETGCTKGFDNENLKPVVRSTRITLNAEKTSAKVDFWFSKRDCSGTPDQTENHKFGNCTENTDGPGVSLYKLTNGSSRGIQLSLAAVFSAIFALAFVSF